MNIISMTITNVSEGRFAFGISDEGDQCFVPPHVADEADIRRGDIVSAQVVLNPNKDHRGNTKWCAVNLLEPSSEQPSAEQEATALSFIKDESDAGGICTDYMIAKGIGCDTDTAHRIAERLFSAGKIARADVSEVPDTNLTLWAFDAGDFTGFDE